MINNINNKLDEAIAAALDKELWEKPQDGQWKYTIYAYYSDEMCDQTAIEILKSDNPMDAFLEKMDEFYCDYQSELESELGEKVHKAITNDDAAFPEGLTDEEDDYLIEYIREHVTFIWPEEHYLNQEFNVNIMVDTGDGNYDYVFNAVYPSWNGKYGETINDKASIVWLSKQQGYKKSELSAALRQGDMENPKGLLESLRVEVANCSSYMNTLTFLVKMSLKDLICLNEIIRLFCKNYDATKNPYCGFIIIGKKTKTGLYDPWQGGGSCFEIQLEKDVRLPIRFIRSALPDGGDGYSISSAYGMCGSAWRDSIKVLHTPKVRSLDKTG